MQATQMLRQAILEQPDRAGTIYNGRRRTWREIGNRVPRLAGALRKLGVLEGECVAAIGMNSDRYLELYFAIPGAGAAFTPLNIRWSVAKNRFAMKDSGPRILFVDDDFLAQAGELNRDGNLTLIGHQHCVGPDDDQHADQSSGSRGIDLSSVKTCVYGGSPMPEAVLDGATRKLPNWGFHQIYGMTGPRATESPSSGRSI
jgi:acyl-CoA synthetase (AMP-forming)/AMP-acid ligase II